MLIDGFERAMRKYFGANWRTSASGAGLLFCSFVGVFPSIFGEFTDTRWFQICALLAAGFQATGLYYAKDSKVSGIVDHARSSQTHEDPRV
jgi:hypothetical protein